MFVLSCYWQDLHCVTVLDRITAMDRVRGGGGGGGRVLATAEGSISNASNKTRFPAPQQFSDNLHQPQEIQIIIAIFFLKFVTAVWNGHCAYSTWVPKHVATPQSSGNRPRYLSRYSDLLRAGWFGVQTLVEGRFSAPPTNRPRGPPRLMQNEYWV